MIPTAVTKIRWLKMMKIKNCMQGDVSNKNCHCADKLRKLLITKPVTSQHEVTINNAIKKGTEKYEKCFHS